jgi:hypothetical protein
MRAAVDRRVFIGGTVAAGVGTALVGFQRPARAQSVHADASVFDAISLEIARISRSIPTQQGPGPLLAMATTFRLFAGAAEAHHADERMQAEMRRLVDSEGRQRLIQRARSPEMAEHRRRVMREAGIPLHVEPIADAVYEQQLDAVLAGGGLVKQMTAGAAALEQAYHALQRQPAAHHHGVARVQNPYIEQIYRCAYFTDQCAHYSSLAELWCSAALLLGPLALALAPICAGLGISAGGYCYAQFYYC